MRLCFSSSLLVSILLAGVPARAAVDDGTLGSKCAADGDCTGGLECVVVGEAFSRAPAGGLCTAPCLLDDECKPHGETALCSGSFCLEGCKTNTTTGPTLDPTKCHGREDMACIGFRCIVPGDTGCLETVDACMPMCAADEQCGPGLFCSHGAASVCQNTQPAGAPPGTACRYALSP
jgi:hypothetical protein